MKELTSEYLASQGLSETFLQRFWSKVNKNGPVPQHCPELGPCWVWTAGKDWDGYGLIKRGIGRLQIRAPRAAWLLEVGPIPEGKQIRHKCDTPRCCNPYHLELGTHANNVSDCVERGRTAKGERHGMHKFSPADILAMRKLYEAGKTCTEIAPLFKTARGYVSSLVSGKNWKHLPACIPRLCKGENHHQHKVTEAQVKDIRMLYAAGNVTMQTLSDQFGINISSVHSIIHHRTWRDNFIPG